MPLQERSHTRSTQDSRSSVSVGEVGEGARFLNAGAVEEGAAEGTFMDGEAEEVTVEG